MDDSLHHLVMTLHLTFTKLLREQIKDTDLTSGQPKVLEYLSYHEGARQKEIAAACLIEPATMTSLLDGMEKNGLIERRQKDGDRRSTEVHLTGKGREMAERIKGEFKAIDSKAMAPLDSAEKAELQALLSRISIFLENGND